MTDPHLLSEQRGTPQYICEVCHREGPMAAFQDECRPGWTHGRLLRIETTGEDALRVARTYRWADGDGDSAELEPPDDPTVGAVALLTVTDAESGCNASVYLNREVAEIVVSRLRAALAQEGFCK